MIKFKRIEISNFVCFDNIVIEPSIDPTKPLTVVRAENGSGKTTLLRAIRWGMYGEKGLPTPTPNFSLHPIWWIPDKKGIRTEVSIEFETDGSTRYDYDITNCGNNTVYLLRRSIVTVEKLAVKDGPNFTRTTEYSSLMIQENNGEWTPFTAGTDLIIDQLLPWELRDFFVMDADEVVDFAGGSNENRTLQSNHVVAKTTAAVNGLLGLDVFKMAQDRVDKIGRIFGKQATVAVGSVTLDELQSSLESHLSEREDLDTEIDNLKDNLLELDDRIQSKKDDLIEESKGIGAVEQLLIRLNNNEESYKNLSERRKIIVDQIARQIEATDLLATLINKHIRATFDVLKPLYDRGYIPIKHLHYVRSLLTSGICVCGQDISQDNKYRNKVLEQISKSSSDEERANYLSQIFDATRSLMDLVPADVWDKRGYNLARDLVDHNRQLDDLKTDKEDIEKKLDKIDKESIQLLRIEIDSLESQINRINREIAGREVLRPNLSSIIDSLEKKISATLKKEVVARDKREAQFSARIIVEVLDKAYTNIQVEQVIQLSKKMDDLFSKMVYNVTSEDFNNESDKADVRMIDRVGLNSVDDRPNCYKIFAHNHLGDDMPATTINGASRRILALSFVLALCDESRTYAPLIADSLLNFLSGAVRRNTLLVTAQTSKQPILLLTISDLESQVEIDIVNEYAGATYTLTAQWDAINAGRGGDVVHWNDERRVSLICSCGPRNYCDICEREGWAKLPGWEKREEKGRFP